MVITTTSKYFKTLEITTRLEAQLMREACVVSRPLILRALAGLEMPEQARRLQRTLQTIYHGVETFIGRKDFWAPLYLHVSPDEAQLLGIFLTQTSAADLHSRFAEGAVTRVGTLTTITPAWEALRSRWTGSPELIRPEPRIQAISA